MCILSLRYQSVRFTTGFLERNSAVTRGLPVLWTPCQLTDDCKSVQIYNGAPYDDCEGWGCFHQGAWYQLSSKKLPFYWKYISQGNAYVWSISASKTLLATFFSYVLLKFALFFFYKFSWKNATTEIIRKIFKIKCIRFCKNKTCFQRW